MPLYYSPFSVGEMRGAAQKAGSHMMSTPEFKAFIQETCEWTHVHYCPQANLAACVQAVFRGLALGQNDACAMVKDLRQASFIEYPSVFTASLLVFRTAVVQLCQTELRRELEARAFSSLPDALSTSVASLSTSI